MIIKTHLVIITVIIALIVGAPVVSANGKERYVSAPDVCYKVEKVDEAGVFFVRGEASCTGISDKVPVKIEDNVKEVSLYKDGALWKKEQIADFNLDAIVGATESGKTFERKITVPENKYQKEAEELAGRLNTYYNSAEFQTKLENETKRLVDNTLNKGANADSKRAYYGDSTKKQESTTLSKSERLYIFVSSSVPLSTIRRYALAVDKLRNPNISIVMRGFIGGAKYTGPTMKFVSDVIVKREGCNLMGEKCETLSAGINIDPLLFARYKIKRVPAIVYVPEIAITDKLGSEGVETNATVNVYHTVYGDVSLDYAVEVISKEAKRPSLERVLSVLRKDYY